MQEELEAEEKERDEYTKQNEDYTIQRDSLKQRLNFVVRESEAVESEIMKESRGIFWDNCF